MARIPGSCFVAPVSVTGGTPQTILKIVTPTNQRAVIQKIVISWRLGGRAGADRGPDGR